eukprot:1573299-Rhodomonas_salina.2
MHANGSRSWAAGPPLGKEIHHNKSHSNFKRPTDSIIINISTVECPITDINFYSWQPEPAVFPARN